MKIQIGLISALFCWISLGATGNIHLYNLQTQSQEPSASDPTHLIRNRVYVTKVSDLKGWSFVVSNGHGELEKPLHVLGTGTILEGSFLGSTNPLERFLLTEKGTWVSTPDEERLVLYTAEKPHYLKLVSLKPSLDKIARVVR